eukprot:493418_1
MSSYVFDRIPIQELLKSVARPQILLTVGYIRDLENEFIIPISIMNYIVISAFYAPLYEYKSDFDSNGIVYAIATRYGQTQWQNPAKQHLITIKSSPHCRWRYGNIEDVLSRTNVKGDCCSDDRLHGRINIDFGAQKKIKPSHYTLRHDGANGYCLRTWNFEASNDGTNWYVLRKHANDTNINSQYGTHTWTIDVEEYYQMFRIQTTAQSSSSGRFWLLPCGGFEIYGHLIVTHTWK